MRKNQVSVKVERFGDQAPEGVSRQTINVYADSNNVAEAMMSAFGQAMSLIEESGVVAVSTCGSSELAPKRLSCSSECFEHQHGKSDAEIRLHDARRRRFDLTRAISSMKTELLSIEHAEEIVSIAKNSDDKESAVKAVQERFGDSCTPVAAGRMLDVAANVVTKDFQQELTSDIEKAEKMLAEVEKSIADMELDDSEEE